MATRPKYLRTKRYWVLILLGPLLLFVLAYAVFAALHLGLGLPWPTREDAGLVASIVEAFGFLAFLTVVEFLALGLIYRLNYFTRGWSTRKPKLRAVEYLAIALGPFAGLVILTGVASAMSLPVRPEFENGGFLIFLAVLASIVSFIGTVQHGERTLGRRATGTARGGRA